MENNNEIELYNPSVEAAILSAIIFDNEVMDDMSDKISHNDFFVPLHRHMYSIMLELREKGRPIDEVFILPELKKKEKHAEEGMIGVMSVNPISNISSYLGMIKNYTQKRALSDLSFKIRKDLLDNDDAQKVLIDAMDQLEKAYDIASTSQNARKISEITLEIRDDMDKAKSGEKLPFYETGYVEFDVIAGGFVENGLTVVAGRPSMGKSSFTSGPIMNSLMNGESSILYSMEVVDKNALVRLVSFRSQEPLSSIKRGLVSGIDNFNESMSFFESSDEIFTIVDRSGMTKRELELDMIRRIKKDSNLKLIVVDHLLQIQLDSARHAPTELGEITKMLKRISQNYKITIVLLSQLNRSVESRDNKRPMMADLQGSGSIEQDADMIVFLYRSEYYKEKEWDQEKDGAYQRKDIEHAEVIIGKNRDGPTGSIELGFRANTASFLSGHTHTAEAEYVYSEDEFNASENERNNNHKGSVKENDDIIDADIEGSSHISMPLI